MKLGLLVAGAFSFEEEEGNLGKLNRQIEAKEFPRTRFTGRSNGLVLQRHFMDAVISYCNDKYLFGFQCICDTSYKDTDIIADKQSNSVVVVAINRKTECIVISYRPTVTWQTWKDKGDYLLMQMPNAPSGAQVHSVFYGYYNSTTLRADTAARLLLRDTRYKSYPLQIVGYSLGAAVAIISLPWWADMLNSLGDTRSLEVITYSGPRSGNEMFAQYLASFRVPITRYTNRNDIVPHLPPRSLGFVHVGHELHEKVDKDGKSIFLSCNDHFDEDPACSYGTEASYSVVRHMLPFNKFVPLPPFCMD